MQYKLYLIRFSSCFNDLCFVLSLYSDFVIVIIVFFMFFVIFYSYQWQLVAKMSSVLLQKIVAFYFCVKGTKQV